MSLRPTLCFPEKVVSYNNFGMGHAFMTEVKLDEFYSYDENSSDDRS